MALPNPLKPFIIRASISKGIQAEDRTRKFVFVSVGDTSLANGTIKELFATDWQQTITNTAGQTKEGEKFAKAFFMQNGTSEKSFFVLELGKIAGANTAETKLQALEEFINGGFSAWMYVMPNSLAQDVYMKTLANSFASNEAQIYFMVTLDNIDPAQSQILTALKGIKSVWLNANNVQDPNLSINGVMAGVMASARFDISITNRLSPFNRKDTPCKFTTLTYAQVQKFTEEGVNFGGSVKGVDCVLNGRFADLRPFTFWYAFDTMQNRVSDDMVQFMLDTVNLANSSLTFNQIGFDMINSRLTASLDACRELGLVDRFGKKKNLGTGEIEGEGSIDMIDAKTYKAQNPDKYKDGICDAPSAFVEVQNFIEQVIFSVNIG